jgi:hypothetical protein
MPDKTQQIIKDRHQTHGDYRKVFEMTQEFKGFIRQGSANFIASGNKAVQLEALDKIATKIARITHGDPNEIDHWQDIAGYAQIVINHLSDKQRAENDRERQELAS